MHCYVCTGWDWLQIPVWLTASQLFVLFAGRGENAFLKQLVAADFVVEEVPSVQLHEEYADGQYQVLRICKLGQ